MRHIERKSVRCCTLTTEKKEAGQDAIDHPADIV
jgi:hypothetical protein